MSLFRPMFGNWNLGIFFNGLLLFVTFKLESFSLFFFLLARNKIFVNLESFDLDVYFKISFLSVYLFIYIIFGQ